MKKRLFISFNLPAAIKRRLGSILTEAKKEFGNIPGLKWADARNFHITLIFLGYLGRNKEEFVKKEMAKFSGRHGEIKFGFGALGYFHCKGLPKVAYLPCEPFEEYPYQMRQRLKLRFEAIKINFSAKAWHPHITLARLKGGQTDIKNFPVFNFLNQKLKLLPNFSIFSFELMESVLKPGGAEHKIRASYKL